MVKPSKIFLNIFLFVLGIAGIFGFMYYDTTTGLAIITIAILFHILSRIGDLQERIAEVKLETIIRPEPGPVKTPPIPEPKPEPEITKPEPEPEPQTFKCKKCQKEFPDEKKLKRHFGMAHYKDLEV